MRFMMMIKATADSEAGRPPSAALMTGMGELTAEMMRSGVLVQSVGLQPSMRGKRIRMVNGQRTVIDGPFTEAKELVGGYAIVNAESAAEAVALGNRVLDIHVDAGVHDVEMEIRPLHDGPDCRSP